MKEKSSKKESNKEEAKQEGHTGLDFAPLQQASPSEDLKINWEAFIRFFNATLRRSCINLSHQHVNPLRETSNPSSYPIPHYRVPT